MNKQTEALKLALEKVQGFKARWWKVPPFGNKVNKATREAITNAHSQIFELENAIREALADSALDRMADNARELGLDYEPAQKLTDEKGRQLKFWGGKAEQPAQQQDNPHPEYFKGYSAGLEAGAISEKKPAQQQESLQSIWDSGPTNKDYEDAMRQKRLNELTAPASKPWVGLTNKDIYECEPKTDWYDSVEFAKAIEAKLREKNA